MGEQPGGTTRRIDLDWIRIAAFGLLILYHVGMVFVPWYYHVKSTHLYTALEPFMLVLNPWRLCLLFFVAGTATRFMAVRISPGPLLRSRSVRLLLPLAFGMLVIVPPQPYWEVVSRGLFSGSFFDFYTERYFAFAAQFCSGGRCIVLPTWNHLWFIAYLWVYTLVLMLFALLLPGSLRRAEDGIARVLSGVWLLALPAIVLVLYRVFLFPRFPQTNGLLDDWYNHALYLSIFMLGFLIARSDPVWDAIVRSRWVSLGVAAVAFAGFIVVRASMPPGGSLPVPWQMFSRTAYGIYQWCCIVTILGFGRRWLNRDSSVRRYLTDAIFPYYIVHQTTIVGVAFALRGAGLSVAAEATIIIAATIASCALSYEIVKRVAWLRPLFGLKIQRSQS